MQRPIQKLISSTPMVPADQGLQSGERCGGTRRPALSLRPYQIKGIEYLRKHGGCGALFWEMRLGKTLTTIRFLSQRSDARRVLVVGPYSCLDGWRTDLQRENKRIALVYKIEPKNRKEYLENLRIGDAWFLLNKEAFLYCDFLSYYWDAVVCDETWLANPKAKITKYFLKNIDAKYRILLSGTPAPESELQYYTQLAFINNNILNCKSYWDFKIRYFRPEGFNWKMTLKGKQFLAKKIAANCSVLKRIDVNLQKEKIFERRIVKLDGKTIKKYHQVAMGLYQDKILKFAGERWVELRRLCSGEEKMEELIYLLKGELKNQKIIIWADYVEEVERIANRLDCFYIHGGVSNNEREEIKTLFLNEKLYLVAQPQCWKWGTNLTGVDMVIFFSMPQSLMCWQQVCERTVDLQNKESLLIVSLVAENTIEEDIISSLYEKETRERQLERFRKRFEKELICKLKLNHG